MGYISAKEKLLNPYKADVLLLTYPYSFPRK